MKLRRIALENLGSLYGPQEVDLAGALADSPLFLVLGPTGAGKSTLLDAVALALFGRTPRLSAGKRDPDSDPRQIMSRGAGACFAQVEISKAEGGARGIYRATWQCRRARGRPDGAFQQPRRVLERCDGDEWKTLISDTREKFFGPVFESLLEGMTVDDFERSVLLPQGEFAAFLRAADKERAAILERLTSTARFRLIGERASAFRQAAERRVEDAARDVEGAALPSEAEEESLRRERADVDARLLAKRFELAPVDEAIAHWRRAAEIEGSLAAKTSALEAVRAERASHREGLERLAESLRCAEAGERRRERNLRRDESIATKAKLPSLHAALEELVVRTAAAEQKVAATLSLRDSTRARSEAEAAGIARARVHRDRSESAARELRSATARHAAASREEEKARRDLGAAEAERTTAETNRNVALVDRDALVALGGPHEGALPPVLAALVEERDRLTALAITNADRAAAARAALSALLEGEIDAPSLRETLRRSEQSRADRERSVREVLRLHEERDAALAANDLARVRLAELTRALESLDETVGAAAVARAECEVRLGAANVALNDLEWMRNIAKERSRLKPDDPCALCGSETHPYVDDERHAEIDRRTAARCDELAAAMALIELEHTDLASKEQTAERERAAMVAVARLAGETERELQIALAGKESALARAFETLSPGEHASRESLDRALASCLSDEESLAKRLRSLSLAETTANQTALAEREASQARLVSSAALSAEQKSLEREAEAKLTRAESALASARDRAAGAGTRTEASARATVLADDEVKTRRVVVEDLARLAKEAGFVDDPDALEAAVLALATDASRAHDDAQTALAHAALARGEALTALARAETLATDRDRRLADADALLAAALDDIGLANERELDARLVDEATLAELTALRSRLDRSFDELSAGLREHQQLEAEHRARRPALAASGASLTDAEAHALDLRRDIEQLGVELTTRTVALRQIEAARERAGVRRKELERLREELSVWERLHRLIGKSSGEAFQLYAQTLNLAELIDRANEHLARFAPRYALVPAATPDGEPRLAFAVGDAFHAGEVRPLTTLSGGETFLVSLALALALASFRRVRMPIETLLLDEGFGVLDPETLGVALSALEALRDDGTQVGIISHVEALKERIGARVLVERVGSGRSRIRIG